MIKNHSRLDVMSSQSPPRYDIRRDGIDEFSMENKSARLTFTQKEGLQSTIRIEVDLVARKLRKIEVLNYKEKWERCGF